MHHYLANEYIVLGKWADAAHHYEQAIRIGTFSVGSFHSRYYLGICHLLQSEFEKAADLACAAIRFDPRYAEGHCLLADIYTCKGELEFARIHYLAALACGAPPADAVLPTQPWAYGEHPLRRLAAIEAALKEHG
jgi:tetratricopeptide (TPR) repeat protein